MVKNFQILFSATSNASLPDSFQANATLLVSLSVDSSIAGNIGDLRGFFFHVEDETLLDGLLVSGSDVTDQLFAANDVSDLGGGVM